MDNNHDTQQKNLVSQRMTRNSKRSIQKRNLDSTRNTEDRKRKSNDLNEELNKIKKDIIRNSKKIKQIEDDSNLYDIDDIEDNIDIIYDKLNNLENKLNNYDERINDMNNNIDYLTNYIEDEDGENDIELNFMEEKIVSSALQQISPILYCKKKMEDKKINQKKIEKELKVINELIESMNNNNIEGRKIIEILDYFMEINNREKQVYIKKIKDINSKKNKKPLYFRILDSDLNDDIKNNILSKYEISCANEHSSEYGKFNNWVNGLFEIPWNKKSEIKIKSNSDHHKISKYLASARLNMDRVIYGQNDTKDHIIQIISKMISNPKKIGNVFALYGPPGTGKTTIIKEGMSRALGIPFTFISLGGATDSSYLQGHNYTYEGSSYGKIIESIKTCKVMNPIFYFDELDKVSNTSKGEEIINCLIHLTDSSQNTLFQDKYFGNIPFDLSNSIFVFSFNDISKVNKILLDRMELINVNGFDLKEKIEIAKNYLLPDLLNNFNIQDDKIIFNDDIINYIVNHNNCSNEEKGVRNIRRRFENIISKLNILLLTKDKSSKLHTKIDKICKNTNIEFPLELTREIVDILINDNSNNDKPPFGMYS